MIIFEKQQEKPYGKTKKRSMRTRYQVFVSSTYSDLKEERSKVIKGIMDLDCIPAGMEMFPAIDEEQEEGNVVVCYSGVLAK